jgi:predicted Zn-dependent peptidase
MKLESKKSDNAYKKTNLDNGITIVSENIETVRSIALGVWVKTGSRFEDSTENGMAHFLEHMMFKGTRKRTPLKIAQSLEMLGGNLNAFTGKEVTCFFANSLDTHLNKGVEVLADMVCNSIFPDKEISKERMVIIEEISAIKDTPEEYIFDLFHEKLFPENPLGRPILGTATIVDKFNRNGVLNFWKKFYSAQNIVIAAAGNLDHEQLLTYVNKYFAFNTSTLNREKEKAIAAKSKYYLIDQSINQAHICMGGESFPYTAEERIPLLVLNAYLGGGMSSRLFQRLREKRGLVYSVYSFVDFYSDIGIFGVYAGTDPQNVALVQELLHQELERVSQKPITNGILAKIKNQLKGNVVLGLEGTSRRMSRLAKNELYFGRYVSIDDLIHSLDRVTPEDVWKVANKIIQPEKFVTVILQSSN